MKSFKFILLFLIIVLTVLISLSKPPMHKSVKFENADNSAQEKNIDINTKENKVVWNKWHSDLSNKILKDKMVPQDESLNTVNFIQFNVDSNGNISNIKIKTEPEKYTKIAQKYYMDYLNSLNGNPILEFPKDSNRKVILVETAITAANTTRYSKPEDFSDNETIRR